MTEEKKRKQNEAGGEIVPEKRTILKSTHRMPKKIRKSRRQSRTRTLSRKQKLNLTSL